MWDIWVGSKYCCVNAKLSQSRVMTRYPILFKVRYVGRLLRLLWIHQTISAQSYVKISHTLQSQIYEQVAKTVVGTPSYLSPEFCQDIPYPSTSDMWVGSKDCFRYTKLSHPRVMSRYPIPLKVRYVGR